MFYSRMRLSGIVPCYGSICCSRIFCEKPVPTFSHPALMIFVIGIGWGRRIVQAKAVAALGAARRDDEQPSQPDTSQQRQDSKGQQESFEGAHPLHANDDAVVQARIRHARGAAAMPGARSSLRTGIADTIFPATSSRIVQPHPHRADDRCRYTGRTDQIP
jgi:hypothetical protein